MGMGNLVCFLLCKAAIHLVQAEETMRTHCTIFFVHALTLFSSREGALFVEKHAHKFDKFEKFFLPLLILSWSIYVALLDLWIGPSCLTDVLFWTGCSAVLCILSSDTVGTPQLLARIWTSGTVLSRCFSPKPGGFPARGNLLL